MDRSPITRDITWRYFMILYQFIMNVPYNIMIRPHRFGSLGTLHVKEGMAIALFVGFQGDYIKCYLEGAIDTSW